MGRRGSEARDSCLLHGVGKYCTVLCAVLPSVRSKLGLGGARIDVNGGHDGQFCSKVCFNRGREGGHYGGQEDGSK